MACSAALLSQLASGLKVAPQQLRKEVVLLVVLRLGRIGQESGCSAPDMLAAR